MMNDNHYPSHQQRTFDLDFPLHPDTDNSETVARLVQGILLDIDSRTAEQSTSRQDIVQALQIAAAVHSAFGELSERTGHAPALDLLDIQVDRALLN